MTVRPLSARNPRVQRLARLARRREDRVEERALVVEGPVLLRTALDAGIEVVEVYVDADAAARPAMAALLGAFPASTSTWSVPPGTLDRVGDAATSQGIVGIVRRPQVAWPVPSSAPFVLLLDEIADPGNAGTLIRAAAAAGAGAVVVSGGVEVSNPKVVRASAGAVFTIPVVDAPSGPEAVTRLRSLGYRVLVTDVREGDPYDSADLSEPVVVVLGNEARGVSSATAAAADGRVTIPMVGPTESLNVAMAGTVLCFEVLRRSRSGGPLHPPKVGD